MNYTKVLSRKTHLLPIYLLWRGLQSHIDEFIAESKEDFISYNPEINCREEASRSLTKTILRNSNFVKDYLDRAVRLTERIRKKAREIRKIKASGLTDQELWSNFRTVMKLIHTSGKTITQARKHAYRHVERELKKEFSQELVSNLLTKLTSPTGKSLAVIEEEELLRKASELTKKPNSKLFNKYAKQHHADWCWIPTDWAIGIPWRKTEIKNKLIKAIKENPEQRLKEIKEDFQEKEKEKKELFSRYIKSIKLKNLIEMMEIEAFYRLHRRYVLSELLHYSQPLFEELAFRMGLKIELGYNLLPEEIKNFLLKGKLPDEKLVRERKKYFVLYGKDNQIKVYYGEEAAKVAKVLYTEIDETLKVLKGGIGCQGKVVGVARVIHTKEDFHKIKEGEILVTHETTPDFVPILHKVKGIITDEGGISCHAAVISREMNIPCVVGTIQGTKVIKDGEEVEVDAIEGVVRRLI